MENEFKGTKGPWQSKKEKGEPEWFIYQKGSMKKMCGGTIRTPVAEEVNNKHDANLIAAAPELLDALQDMLSGWQYIRSQHGDLYGIGWDRAQDKAISAINKALGK